MANHDLTALLSAFGRAWHAENDPEPLFTDPLPAPSAHGG